MAREELAFDDTVSYTQQWKSKLAEVMGPGIEPPTFRLGVWLRKESDTLIIRPQRTPGHTACFRCLLGLNALLTCCHSWRWCLSSHIIVVFVVQVCRVGICCQISLGTVVGWWRHQGVTCIGAGWWHSGQCYIRDLMRMGLIIAIILSESPCFWCLIGWFYGLILIKLQNAVISIKEINVSNS